MSVKMLSWAFEQDLPCAEKFVLVALADMSDMDGKCWPSQALLASRCGIARETVNRQIKMLSNSGLIRVEHRLDANGQHSNLYFIRCDAGSHAPVTDDHSVSDGRSLAPVTHDHTEPSIRTVKETNPLTPLKGGVHAREEFEGWWKECPRKVGKDAAARKYAIARRSADAETLLAGIQRYRSAMAGTDPQFVVHPAAWLHQGRWKDELPNGEAAHDHPTGPPPNPEELWPELREAKQQ